MPRFLEHPRAPRLVVLVGLVLALPTLAIGFFSDDWFMLAALRQRWPLAPAWWDLYDFTPQTDAGIQTGIRAGWLPWWTAPSLRIHLMRPLSSALLALDERLFGDAAIGWHLHSLVWWGALLALVAALYRRLVPGATGTLALLVFAVVPAHAMTYGWISSRHMLVSAVPAFAALLAHVRWREERWAPGRWLGPIGLVVGLAGGEAGLGGITLWLAYEAFGPEALGERKERAIEAAPALAIVVAYLALYPFVGGVVQESGAYVSPMKDPATFLALAALRFPMLLGHALLEVPVEASFGKSPAPFVVAGVIGVALCGGLWRASRDRIAPEERAAVRWLLPGALLATLGTCGGLPGGRALVLANLGGSALLAILIRRGWERGTKAFPRRLGAGILAAIHLGFSPLLGLGGTLAEIAMGRQSAAVARRLPADVRPARRVFLLEASDPMLGIYATATLLAEGGSGLECIARLTSAVADHEVTRLDERTLAIEPVGGPMLVGPFEVLYRAHAIPFHEGDEIAICGARVRVTGVDDGRPRRLEVRFEASLDDPSVATVAWDGERLAPVRFAVGETRVLPWVPGPMRTQ